MSENVQVANPPCALRASAGQVVVAGGEVRVASGAPDLKRIAAAERAINSASIGKQVAGRETGDDERPPRNVEPSIVLHEGGDAIRREHRYAGDEHRLAPMPRVVAKPQTADRISRLRKCWR